MVSVLIALAVALLPAARGAASMPPDAGPPGLAVAEPMHDCCPDEADPCDQGAKHCAFMTACVCFSFTAASYWQLVLPASAAASVPLPASAALPARAVGPPFRPPRGWLSAEARSAGRQPVV